MKNYICICCIWPFSVPNCPSKLHFFKTVNWRVKLVHARVWSSWQLTSSAAFLPGDASASPVFWLSLTFSSLTFNLPIFSLLWLSLKTFCSAFHPSILLEVRLLNLFDKNQTWRWYCSYTKMIQNVAFQHYTILWFQSKNPWLAFNFSIIHQAAAQSS